MADKKTALVLGATGLIGSHLLSLLLEDKRYSLVRVLVRKPLPIQHANLQQITANFDTLSAYKNSFAVDDVFCCLGTTIKKAGSQEAFYKVDATYPYEAARLAKEKEARQYLIVTAMGADKNSRIFYNRVKGEVEEKIAGLNFPAFHMLHPSLLMGERNEKRTGEQIGQAVMGTLGFLMVGPLKKYKAIEGSTVAKAMLNIANQNLSGMHIYESDQLQELGK
ncbi:oxidoreductase [Rhodocytophaga rosea]|uniref:Oxidoreductase n=1 Tax=Rhodocytophaga rosea TaxID=2704465 RepID=A0A6C0GP22_9BACT|nr:oxidoreductase [Rhodocytophaga rosea]QHT69789.1 oxidoreductase [Rhodocytophaga rosea]